MDNKQELGDKSLTEATTSDVPRRTNSTEDKDINVNSQVQSPTGRQDISHREMGDLEATLTSGAVSIKPQPVKVPSSQRRGLFGRFTMVAEVEEPKDYASHTKWFITFIVSMAAMAAPMGSAIFFPSLNQVARDFKTSAAVVNLSVALYMLSMSIFPLWWSSFSETLGRRTIYLVSFALFVVFSILSAVSTSVGMLIVMRVLGGGAAASVQAVGAGTIADIWEVRERGRAMGIFYLGPLMGPLLAPIIGGVLGETLGWRSTMWFLAIFGAVLVILLFLALPETLKARKSVLVETEENALTDTNGKRPELLSRASSRKVVQNKTRKWVTILKRTFIDPLKIILYLRFPAVLLTVYCASIAFGSLYILNISLQDSFSKAPYNFSTIIVGLTYIPNSIGYLLASLFGGKWTDKIMAREARRAGRYDEKGRLIYIPEDRMRENAYLGAILYPAVLIWYGWTMQKGVFWLVPLIANFFFGIGSMLIFAMSTTMLTEFMPKKASSGVAVNNFVRNIFSCIGGEVAQPLIAAIGNGWLFTGLGVIASASSIVVWVMRRFGPKWRESMNARMG